MARGPWGPHENGVFDWMHDRLGPEHLDLANRITAERWHRREHGRDRGFGGSDPISQHFGAQYPLLYPGRGGDTNTCTPEDFDHYYGLREHGYHDAWNDLYGGRGYDDGYGSNGYDDYGYGDYDDYGYGWYW